VEYVHEYRFVTALSVSLMEFSAGLDDAHFIVATDGDNFIVATDGDIVRVFSHVGAASVCTRDINSRAVMDEVKAVRLMEEAQAKAKAVGAEKEDGEWSRRNYRAVVFEVVIREG
jgi:hypothetical protein